MVKDRNKREAACFFPSSTLLPPELSLVPTLDSANMAQLPLLLTHTILCPWTVGLTFFACVTAIEHQVLRNVCRMNTFTTRAQRAPLLAPSVCVFCCQVTRCPDSTGTLGMSTFSCPSSHCHLTFHCRPLSCSSHLGHKLSKDRLSSLSLYSLLYVLEFSFYPFKFKYL